MTVNELIEEMRKVKNKHSAAMIAECRLLMGQCEAPKELLVKALFDAVFADGKRAGVVADADV